MREYGTKERSFIDYCGTRTGSDSCMYASDPGDEYADPTGGSAENNSKGMLARPASDLRLAGHDLTPPVRFPSPFDPIRPDP